MPSPPLAGLTVLVVDDETLLRKQLGAHLEQLGAEVWQAGTLAAARELVGQAGPDFVLLDVNLPDGIGSDLLKQKVFSPNTSVIVMTANGGVTGAVEAMQLGAIDYLVKPFDPAELTLVLGRARRARQLDRVEEHRQKSDDDDSFFFGTALAPLEGQLGKILNADQRMQTDLPPVLIEGETGTGKTTIARWLHRHGPRAKQPLIEVNCSGLPDALAESELFGHERGAFTDARSARIGLFEAASGGTLFLDELPSLPLALQAKVLTAIEDRKIRRLGGNKTLPVDVRIIAAANRDLRALVEEGVFREDLFHRLDLYRVAIPPLRTRGDDIMALAQLTMARLCRRHRLPLKQITEAGSRRLRSHRWPGNVRQLAHELERAIVFDDSTDLNFEHLAPEASLSSSADPSDWLNPGFVFPESGFLLEKAIDRMIGQALLQSGQNVSAAARLLGVSRDYIRYRLAKPGE